jgi:S-adenosylmethionine decarboxylase
MGGLGSHILIDLWGVPGELLDDADTLVRLLEDCAREGGARVVESRTHRFAPHGVSGVVILGQSHLAIHTWPELGFAAADVFTCGRSGICRRVAEAVVSRLGPQRYDLHVMERGAPEERSEGPS